MLLNLNSQEIQRLHKLSQDKATVEALKKLFLNQFCSWDLSNATVQEEAAAYLAIQGLERVFIYLNNIQPSESVNKIENMV